MQMAGESFSFSLFVRMHKTIISDRFGECGLKFKTETIQCFTVFEKTCYFGDTKFSRNFKIIIMWIVWTQTSAGKTYSVQKKCFACFIFLFNVALSSHMSMWSFLKSDLSL